MADRVTTQRERPGDEVARMIVRIFSATDDEALLLTQVLPQSRRLRLLIGIGAALLIMLFTTTFVLSATERGTRTYRDLLKSARILPLPDLAALIPSPPPAPRQIERRAGDVAVRQTPLDDARPPVSVATSADDALQGAAAEPEVKRAPAVSALQTDPKSVRGRSTRPHRPSAAIGRTLASASVRLRSDLPRDRTQVEREAADVVEANRERVEAVDAIRALRFR